MDLTEITNEPITEFDSSVDSTSVCSAELDIQEECFSNTVSKIEEQTCMYIDDSDDDSVDDCSLVSEKGNTKLTYSSDWSSIVELLEKRSLDDIRLYFDKCKQIAQLEIEVLNKRLEEAKTNINNSDLICKLEEQIQNLKEQIEKI